MKKVTLIMIYSTLVIITLSAFVGLNTQTSTLFKTVIIGKQSWMAENLNVDQFRNGDPIPEAKTHAEWKKAGEEGKPAWCYYDNKNIQNDPVNGEKYGKLYNWHAVNDPRGLAPSGLHVPSKKEWKDLIDYLGGEEIAGKKLKSISGWKNGNGTNESGFSGLPGSLRIEDKFSSDRDGYFWASTEYDVDNAQYFFLYDDGCMMEWGNKYFGLSVRCLKD